MREFQEIDDDEVLYRKVPLSTGWYEPKLSELKPDAFNPRSADVTGISFDRAKSDTHPEFRSIEEAARGPSSRGYYVAVYHVSKLREHGFTIVSDPLEGGPGHALLQDLTYNNRREDSSVEKKVLLAHQLVERVEGPFLPEP